MSEQTFTDPIAQEYYRQGETELETTQSADAVLRKAEAFGQKDARSEIMQSAFYFLAAAHFLEGRDASQSAQAYHQAGQQLHRLAQYTQAGRAYSNAGRVAERAAQTVPDGGCTLHGPLRSRVAITIRDLHLRSPHTRLDHLFHLGAIARWY